MTMDTPRLSTTGNMWGDPLRRSPTCPPWTRSASTCWARAGRRGMLSSGRSGTGSSRSHQVDRYFITPRPERCQTAISRKKILSFYFAVHAMHRSHLQEWQIVNWGLAYPAQAVNLDSTVPGINQVQWRSIALSGVNHFKPSPRSKLRLGAGHDMTHNKFWIILLQFCCLCYLFVQRIGMAPTGDGLDHPTIRSRIWLEICLTLAV